MTGKATPIARLAGFLLAFGTAATAQSTGEFWPQANVYTQLGKTTRALAYTGLDEGEDYPYSQWKLGAQLSFQLKPLRDLRLHDIDSDKNHHLPLAIGYEYLATTQSGSETHEDRLVVDATPGFRPHASFLVRDRNRIEFRWKDGKYSTRYRNRVQVDVTLRAGDLRFTPYTSGEVFHDSSHGWYETQFALGVQVPYRRLFMVDTYYLRQDCSSCTPDPVNVWGLTLNLFLRNRS
jgi:hypothetical protein